MSDARKFLGKYRGTVVDNIDPMQTGRLLVQVPDVTNILPSSWAMPCLPFAGIQSGFYAVPEIGSTVWPGLQQIVVQTVSQNTLLISDVPGPTGGILLKSSTGALISVSDTGITISNGQGATILMTGPSVTVNEGALEVI